MRNYLTDLAEELEHGARTKRQQRDTVLAALVVGFVAGVAFTILLFALWATVIMSYNEMSTFFR